MIEHNPNSLEVLLVLVAVQTEMGLERQARATLEAIWERFPAVDFDKWPARHPFTYREGRPLAVRSGPSQSPRPT